MGSIICIDIPVQMISCTDTNSKITPMRFRFRDKNGEIIIVKVETILSEDQDINRVGANFTFSYISDSYQEKLFPTDTSFFILSYRSNKCQPHKLPHSKL